MKNLAIKQVEWVKFLEGNLCILEEGFHMRLDVTILQSDNEAQWVTKHDHILEVLVVEVSLEVALGTVQHPALSLAGIGGVR